MARATGSELLLVHDPDIQFPYRYSFKYRKIKFYQLETEEIREEEAWEIIGIKQLMDTSQMDFI